MDSAQTIDDTVIPDDLRQRDQWVCWKKKHRDGKATKIPVTPETGVFASSTDADTWTDFETALDYVTTGAADGIGFVFAEDDPIVGVDLDDCRNPESGDVDDTALDIIERLDSYTEVSPSGTGYHVLIKGELPEGRNRRGNIELYDKARFFTVTGDHVEETPTRVARRQDALVAIHREYVQDIDSVDDADHSREINNGDDVGVAVDVDLENDELLQKAKNASNGAKFERLWNGNTAGYDSQSEADMALCCLLAFWTGGDATWMDQLFRQSGLLREKWDEIHYADGSTYGEKTIERAIATTSEFYDPDTGDESSVTTDAPVTSGFETTRDESTRNQAYLTEKNRLLTDRIIELEAELEAKDDRIETLEAELEFLESEHADGQSPPATTTQTAPSSISETNPPPKSIWERTKTLLGDNTE
ncbi:hypothetical protein V5735_13105 (plasmid) [Haladaptatus sp. SPP-AMP-3]|uniref:phage NrS-1 polymerase family protein n=1 Tax=Haladaptatus sp. SPP-AMP-3 TaxID=3121295 RepID=UPI003C2DEAAB